LKRSGDTLHTRAHNHTQTHTTSRQLHVLSFVSGTCLVEQRGLLFQNSMSGVFLVWKGTTLDPRYLFDRGGLNGNLRWNNLGLVSISVERKWLEEVEEDERG